MKLNIKTNLFNMDAALIFMGALIFFAHVFNALFQKTRIPSVLILIVIGIIIGPILKLVSIQSLGATGGIFTTVTLITILYESGTELKLTSVGKTIGGASYMAIMNFVIAALIGLGIGHLILGFDIVPSLFLGAAAGGCVAATVVIPMLGQLNLGKKANDIMSLESALSDVVCLVIALALFSAMTGGGEISFGGIALELIYSLIVAVIIGGLLGLVWMFVLRKFMANLDYTMFTTFALAFILYGTCHYINVNGAIAVLAFGIMIGNAGHIYMFVNRKGWVENNPLSSYKEAFLYEDEKNFTGEIVFILQTYFYVYVGVSMQFDKWSYFIIAFVFTVLIFVTRRFVIMALGKKGYSKRDRQMMSILGPKGLVSAVLGSLPIQYVFQQQSQGVEVSQEQIDQALAIQGISYATILISITVCSILVFFYARKNPVDNEKIEDVDSLQVDDNKLTNE